MIRVHLAAAAALVMAAPATAQAPVAGAPAVTEDPATLAAARRVAAHLMPPGIYKQIMGPMMDPILGNMGQSMKALPLRQLAQLGGMTAEEAAKLDHVDMATVMAIYDPHWEERMRLSMRAMIDSMADFFTTMEPDMREGMAKAYAHRFTLAELDDVDRFFGTPSGEKFANRYMTIMTDPAVAAQMKALMPKMIAQMPRFVAAAQKATAALPAPRKINDLTAAERATLAKALGVTQDKLHDPKGTL